MRVTLRAILKAIELAVQTLCMLITKVCNASVARVCLCTAQLRQDALILPAAWLADPLMMHQGDPTSRFTDHAFTLGYYATAMSTSRCQGPRM